MSRGSIHWFQFRDANGRTFHAQTEDDTSGLLDCLRIQRNDASHRESIRLSRDVCARVSRLLDEFVCSGKPPTSMLRFRDCVDDRLFEVEWAPHSVLVDEPTLVVHGNIVDYEGIPIPVGKSLTIHRYLASLLAPLFDRYAKTRQFNSSRKVLKLLRRTFDDSLPNGSASAYYSWPAEGNGSGIYCGFSGLRFSDVFLKVDTFCVEA